VYLDLQPDSAGSFLHVSRCGLGVRGIGRVDEYCNTSGLGYQLVQKTQPLCHYLPRKEIDAGRVASRPSEASDKTELDWVFIDSEHNWDRRGCGFDRDRDQRGGRRDDHRHATAD
jgi:hypothetical protein